jgi:plasmid stability protein
MANLIVPNVDDAIANALKVQASQHGISKEWRVCQILAIIIYISSRIRPHHLCSEN